MVTYDTAGSREDDQGEEDARRRAAIASEKAAEIYGMKVLKKGIEDYGRNFTRFLIISKNEGKKTRDSKTSIIFSVPHTPGSLYHALEVFATEKINLDKDRVAADATAAVGVLPLRRLRGPPRGEEGHKGPRRARDQDGLPQGPGLLPQVQGRIALSMGADQTLSAIADEVRRVQEVPAAPDEDEGRPGRRPVGTQGS